MIEAHGTAVVRTAEEPLLAAGVPLMDRAAFALAERTAARVRSRRGRVGGARAALLVGPGNNGGDTLFAGARLRRRGVAVTAYLLAERVHAGGLAALRRTGGGVVDVSSPGADLAGAARAVAAADVVLDGLLGTGARGGLRAPASTLVAALGPVLGGRAAGARGPLVVAVDVPSGIGVDDGTVPGPVLRADVTVTFGAPKRGLLLPPAAALAGEVVPVDIGLDLRAASARGGHGGVPVPVRRLDAYDLASEWPAPAGTDQKYTRGVLGVVAGTSHFPGAAVLAASGAVRAGAGMVRYVGPDAVAAAVLAARPEVVPAEGRVQAWAVGPGLPAASVNPLSDDEHAVPPDVDAQHREVRGVLAVASGRLARGVGGGRVPVVVDAGALSLVADRVPPSVVLTPHAGELAVLLRARGAEVTRADVEAAPLAHATRAHELTGATVLLKGAVTLVVGPGVVWSQADAPAWLATAGAGDVLTGVLGALLAARSDDVLADDTLAARLAAVAASVHGRAARAANPGGPVAALDVAAAVPGVVADLLRRG